MEDYEYLLHSRRNYKKLEDSIYDSDGNSTECAKFNSQTQNYPGFYDFCIRLTGIIKNIEKIQFDNLFDNKHSTLLNIWIYDKLFSKLIKGKEHNIYTLIGWIFGLCYRDEVQICDIHTDIPNMLEFEKMKMLYDYATNYESLERNLRDNSYECTHNFKEYLDKYVNQYKEAKRKCVGEKTEKYCKLLTAIDSKYNNNELSKLECRGIKAANASFGEDFSRGRHGSSTDYEDPDSLGGREVLEKGNSHLSNAMAFVFPLFCIILTFLILYKFTSFGPWIHSRFLKKKIIERDIDEEEMYELLERPNVSMTINSHNGTHNIGYHSM
ncbi:PIR Superfamily Protein [Plasmodium ovale curtisi]|uniref:PIR Superfamily Protein n=1 Tax=Plasmodium ovale curtisi TaxID=864141 RepID=A0A1A8WCZ8_PLAOA|nr:PIR Superfamily Protein [Plasmodium ovale curtisi]SBT02155.1 PIR Superfamily Protein [Plasmodium ovale curtisi]